jgi:hypothetical protein
MFRRATIGALAAATLGFLTIAGAASASAQVTQDRFHGPFAEAGWETSTPTSATEADTLISREQDGTTHLNIHEYTTYLDSSGNVTSSVDIHGALAGAEMTFDTVGLTTASASGTVPVTRCSFDAAGEPTGCTNGTLGVSETWTGQGPITRGLEDLYWSIQPGNVTYIEHGSGTFRLASATATIGGQTFDASDLQFADLGVSNDLTVTICPHGC